MDALLNLVSDGYERVTSAPTAVIMACVVAVAAAAAFFVLMCV